MLSIEDALALARQHHRSGNLQQAEMIYRQILQADPRNADALHLLGVIAHQVGKHDLAAQYIGQAISIDPDDAGFHNNLGEVYRAQGRLTQAATHYQEAIQLRPDFAEPHYNLGNVLKEQGHLDEAVSYYQEAVRLRPNYADAHNNLGNCFLAQGRYTDAVGHYQHALRLKPDLVAVHNNLGLALQNQEQFAAAVDQFKEAIRMQPDFAEAHSNLGSTYKALGRSAEAVAKYQEAVRLKPHFAEGHNNLGLALQGQGQLAEAVAHHQEAIRLKPGQAESHNNLGVALMNQGRLAEAADHFRQAIHIDPADTPAHSNLLFCLNYDPDVTPGQLFEEHRSWAAGHGQGDRETRRQGDKETGRQGDKETRREGDKENQGAASVSLSPCLPVSLSVRRLRIGYVSPDFREHAVARFIEPVLAAHDREQFEVFCYAAGRQRDAVTDRLQTYTDTWRTLFDLSDDAAAACIRRDGIDILVDLAGHTAGNRLLVFARKPAPIQVTYLGYPNTTSLAAMDYRLTDRVADPPGEPNVHTEELIHLPGTFCCFTPPANAPEVTPLPARAGQGRVTFGSLHKLAKLNEKVLDLWCRLLHELPTARLLVAYHTLQGKTRDDLYQLFAKRGITSERLVLQCLPITPPEQQAHLRQYQQIDILLDTFPWTGHATTCESLWMGVPVLTLCGVRHAQRMAASILTSVGLTEFIAATQDDYVARGVRLAGDVDRLAELREGMRERLLNSPLLNGAEFTRGLEDAYREMWRRLPGP